MFHLVSAYSVPLSLILNLEAASPMPNTKITVVSTTNRTNSLTAQVADYYATLLQQQGCDSQVLKLTDLPPAFTSTALYENKGKNTAFNLLQEVMKNSQKYVFIVPEYNGSFPGVFKAFIDGLDFPVTFKGKKCALVGLSQGPQGGIFAMGHLTDIFHYLNMYVYPLKLRLGNIKDSQLATLLANQKYLQLLNEQAAGIIHY
jgi:chromate reductase